MTCKRDEICFVVFGIFSKTVKVTSDVRTVLQEILITA